MNPEFTQENFIPDFEKEYKCMPDIVSTGFSYIHALVLGHRLHELKEYSLLADNFKTECELKTSNGFTPLALAFGDENKSVLRILFPFYEYKTIQETIYFLINIKETVVDKIRSMKIYMNITMKIQGEIIEHQKRKIEIFEHRLSDRETYKEAFTVGGMSVLDQKIMTYI
ncbi:MAG: hypothetical protein PHG66_01155 [Candidatus Colwellbacteria bacterium]|nr:hypothetical protein [Candidatus Colwellbacteria bacterium]